MSQIISIANKPKISDDVTWRRDGEDDQIIVLSKEEFPLPVILNPTASRIFLLCNGKNTLKDIAQALMQEFALEDFSVAIADVKRQIEYFLDKGIINC
jgi:hypothetical protein